jgi:1-acyl-sn-glycerol-3-phosphate acyltransferase
VPVIVRGTRSIMVKDRWRIKPGNVTLSIKKPIDTTGYTRDNKDDLIKTVRSVICEVFVKGKKIDTNI